LFWETKGRNSKGRLLEKLTVSAEEASREVIVNVISLTTSKRKLQTSDRKKVFLRRNRSCKIRFLYQFRLQTSLSGEIQQVSLLEEAIFNLRITKRESIRREKERKSIEKPFNDNFSLFSSRFFLYTVCIIYCLDARRQIYYRITFFPFLLR
jgi:hypothetical protein